MIVELPKPSELRSFLRRLIRHEQIVLWGLALVIGLLTGTGELLFRGLIGEFQWLFLGFHSEYVASEAAQQPWWRILLAPALGGLAVGLLIKHFMPGGRPVAVAHVMEAAALRGGRMSIRTGITGAVVNALSIGCGASVGREGPIVHLGASLGGWVAERLHLERSIGRTLLGCGAAGAVAAAFNAPIAGTFFALEVVVGSYGMATFAPIVIASVTATIISRSYYGDFPAFILPNDLGIQSFLELPAFVLLGLTSAVAAILFIRSIQLSTRIAAATPLPQWLRPTVAGLGVGLIALWFPQVLGVGYEATDAAISERYALWFMLALIVLKTAATAISLGWGFGGGIFSPSLYIGAMVGGAFGAIATGLLPEFSSGRGAYTLVGMGAVAGAVLNAPISTILIVFELTGDYSLTIAVMIATAIASIVVRVSDRRSFFEWQLAERGIELPSGTETSWLHAVKAEEVMDTDYATVAPGTCCHDIRHKLQDAPFGELFVVDESGRLVGMITFPDLHEAAFDTSRDDELDAAALMRPAEHALDADDHLSTALRLIRISGEVHMPVVSDHESMTMIGVAHEHDLMVAYHEALLKARKEERGEL